MITFRGREIPGLHTSLVATPPNFQSRESSFFGLAGLSQIVGQQIDREVTCEIWLTEQTWTSTDAHEVFDEIEKLDQWVGENGTVEEKARDGVGLPRQFRNCTFMGFLPQPLDHQRDPQPLRDIARGLHDYNDEESDGAWFIFGRLFWRQLIAGSKSS